MSKLWEIPDFENKKVRIKHWTDDEYIHRIGGAWVNEIGQQKRLWMATVCSDSWEEFHEPKVITDGPKHKLIGKEVYIRTSCKDPVTARFGYEGMVKSIDTIFIILEGEKSFPDIIIPLCTITNIKELK